MSWQALADASKYRAASAAEKLIALAYAECHNEETGCAYPSLAWLCEFSSLNRKTVIAAVARLEGAGVLVDTGDRRGDTRQIKVYRVSFNGTESGTVPKSEQFQNRNSTEKVSKQSQKRDTEPLRTITSQKASPSSRKRADEPRFILPADIPADDWRDFEEMRMKIRKPMTDAAREAAVKRLRKLAADGWPPGDVLSHSTLNNYQGLFPPKDDRYGTHQRNHGSGARSNDGFLNALHEAAGYYGTDH